MVIFLSFSFSFNSKYSECCLHNNDDGYIVFINDPSSVDLNVIYMHKFITHLNFRIMCCISLFFLSGREMEVNSKDRIWDYYYIGE